MNSLKINKCPLNNDYPSDGSLGFLKLPTVASSTTEIHDDLIQEVLDLIVNDSNIDQVLICDPFFFENLKDATKNSESMLFFEKICEIIKPNQLTILSKDKPNNELSVKAKTTDFYYIHRTDWHDRNIILKSNSEKYYGLCVGHSVAELNGSKGYVTGTMKETDSSQLFETFICQKREWI